MKLNNINEITIYTNKLNGTEVYTMVDEYLVESIQGATPAYIVGGQIFIRFADKLNMKFDDKLVESVTQNCDTEILVRLKDRSLDTDTLGTISRNMINNYIFSSLHIEEFLDDRECADTALTLVYRKN